jgi:hypothetical protein
MVQTCLRDERDLSELTNLMHSIAKSDVMTFTDGSKETKADLNEIRKPAPTTPIMHLDIGAFDSDGVSFGGGDVRLSNNQVVIGFFEGSNASKAHRFADEVVNKLRSHWQVETVPSGRLPNLHCRGHS